MARTGRKAPNVICFVVDEMRADHLHCAGNGIVQTPHLDHLAAEGVRFSRAYCNNPICMPARTSMFTGLLPRDHGVWHNNMEMHSGLSLLPQLLAEAGYRTHAAGKLHLSRWVPSPDLEGDIERFPESLRDWQEGKIERFPVPYYGFQSVDFVGGHGSYVYGDYFRWLEGQTSDARRLLGPEGAVAPLTGAPQCYKMGLPEELHYNRWIADRSVRAIENAHASNQPIFLWCSFPDPHMPFCPPLPYCDMYDPADMPLPFRRQGEIDELPPYYKAILNGDIETCGGREAGLRPDAHWQEMLALTYGMVTFIDTEVGRIMARIDQLGIRDNTIVLFISDHGDMMGDHWMIYKGPFMFEGCTRIPFIMSVPGGTKGTESSGLVCQIDLMPTILDLCGVEPPQAARLDMKDPPYTLQQVQSLDAWPGRSLRPIMEGTGSLARNGLIIQNDDPYIGPHIRTYVTDRFKITAYPGQPYGELFDLETDPHELHNLWHRAEWIQTRDELLRCLFEEDTRLAPWTPLPYWNA